MWAAVSLLNVSTDLNKITPVHVYWGPFCGLISSKGLMVGTGDPLGDSRWHQAGGTMLCILTSWICPQKHSQVPPSGSI